MALKRMTRASKRRLVIFGTFSFIVIGYFIFSFGYYMLNIQKLEADEKMLQDQLISLKDDASNLENEIQKLKDPDYVARYARESYLYSKDGEYIIKFENKEKELSQEINDHSIYFYVMLGLCVALFGVLGLVVRYRKKEKAI